MTKIIMKWCEDISSSTAPGRLYEAVEMLEEEEPDKPEPLQLDEDEPEETESLAGPPLELD